MDRLYRLYESYYGCKVENVLPMTGSASNRRYCRLTSGAGTCVGVVGTDYNENKAFITLSCHFRSKGITAPEVLAVSEDGMAYLQEDLGRDLLFNLLTKARKTGEGLDKVEEYLCRAMSILPKIQFEAAEGLDFSVCYPQPAFDRRMVMFDLNYFKYCFLKTSGLEFNEAMLQDDFERFADDLLGYDTDTFLYRDFNARNVMMVDDMPYFIDFQGGRRGPIYYDVASFVWHARAEYSDELRERMICSYLDSLSAYMDISRKDFDDRVRLFVLFRTMQVMGAYGFRGWSEHKAKFVASIPPAIDALRQLLAEPFDAYPYMTETLRRLTALPRFADLNTDGMLEVKVYSFSFMNGMPQDPTGNGGGYVFDCRSINNPGRHIEYKNMTGMDEPVIKFLEEDGGVFGFLENAYRMVDPHIRYFLERGFTSLIVSFGCTGGQHRSVYCAEHMAAHLAKMHPEIRVRLIHREQGVDRCVKNHADMM